MLNFPKLDKLPKKEICISHFNGINTDKGADENSIRAAYNMDADAYPRLVTRGARREVYRFPENEKIKAILHSDRVYMVTQTDGKGMTLYWGEDLVPYVLYYTAEEDEMATDTICKFGSWLCIFNLKDLGYSRYEALMIPDNRLMTEFTRVELPYIVDVLVYKNRVFAISKHGLHSCAYGDIKNWNADEIREDFFNKAYDATQNATAPFIACRTYKDLALFFTSKEMYKLTGTGSDTFLLEKIANVGIVSKKAICECGGNLYFMSKEGLIKFNGNSTSIVHTPFDDFNSINECMLCAGEKTVYIDIKGEGKNSFYSYNTVQKAFAEEERWQFVSGTTFCSKPYFATEEAIYEFENLFENAQESGEFEWRVETQRISDALPRRNRGLKIEIGANIEKGSTAQVWADIDDEGWQIVYNLLDGKKDICIPLHPKDIKSIRVALVGNGEATVRYIKLKCNDSIGE